MSMGMGIEGREHRGYGVTEFLHIEIIAHFHGYRARAAGVVCLFGGQGAGGKSRTSFLVHPNANAMHTYFPGILFG